MTVAGYARITGEQAVKTMSTIALGSWLGFLLVSDLGTEPCAGQESTAASIREDWSDWRGPRRDGISRETGLLLEWGKHPPQRRWQRPLGSGYSSMTIVDGRVFTMAVTAEGEFVFALDASNGKTLWKVRSGATVEDSYGDGPRGTPVVDHGRVYALGAHGDLLCLQVTTGKEVWRRNILKDFGAPNIRWGISSTPLIVDDNLIVQVGAKTASIVSLNKTTGQLVWKTYDDVSGYSSPLLIRVPGPAGPVPHVVVHCGRSLVGIAPSDGEVHWKFPWLTTNDMNIATPIFDPKRRLLFVSASRDTGRCSAYRLTVADEKIRAEEVYTNKQMRNHYNGCILVGDYLYGFDNAILKCLELETGKVMWEDRTVGKGSLLAVQDHLLVLGEKGEMAVVLATPEEYVEKGRFPVLRSRRAWTPPALAQGHLYVRDLQEITSIDLNESAGR